MPQPRQSSVNLSALTILWSRVQIFTTPTKLLYSQILYSIIHYIEERDKTNKERPGLVYILKSIATAGFL